MPCVSGWCAGVGVARCGSLLCVCCVCVVVVVVEYQCACLKIRIVRSTGRGRVWGRVRIVFAFGLRREFCLSRAAALG